MINRDRPSNEDKSRLKHLQGLVKNKADALNIHQSVLSSKKELEKLMRGSTQGKLLNGWRFDCIGQQLLAEIEQ